MIASQLPLDGVRPERTGWRDESLSRRHRDWGFNCPAVDLDFLMVEYNLGKAVCIVEYKHARARMPDLRHPTYRALADLADGYRGKGLPFMLAFYWPGIWAFRVTPVNALAKEWFEGACELTEAEYVGRLYAMRQNKIQVEVLGRLNVERPPS